jgi:hypothetical protein
MASDHLVERTYSSRPRPLAGAAHVERWQTPSTGRKNMTIRILASGLSLALGCMSALAASPYAGQESREIKALSAEDISALLAGKGMGFAKTAELNGFAGPAHVLELARELHLTVEQRVQTQALFSSMSARAVAAGRALVEKERELDGCSLPRQSPPSGWLAPFEKSVHFRPRCEGLTWRRTWPR